MLKNYFRKAFFLIVTVWVVSNVIYQKNLTLKSPIKNSTKLKLQTPLLEIIENERPIPQNLSLEQIQQENKVKETVERNKLNDCIIVTASNYGFKEILLNLLVSLQMNNFFKFMVLCYDVKLFDFLSKRGFESNIAMIPDHWYESSGISSDFEVFNNGKYNKLVRVKTRIFLELLKQNHSILFTDSDTVWLDKNVLNHIQYNNKFTYAHIMFSQDQNIGINHFNTGFFYAKSTDFTKDLFLKVLIEQKKNPNSMEQFVLNGLLDKIKYNENRIGYLDHLLFVTGKTFIQDNVSDRLKIKPYVVHMNYIVGKDSKINAFVSKNTWFLNQTSINEESVLLPELNSRDEFGALMESLKGN